uniref:Uncharacterized protein n=1 Tax=Chromera velia CCMP2878 TaxID=1169474 RepID=A0A0G4IEX0_9ALVE|eukprot:Cvel_2418.t1-p1 / transcript=Cvel_2418.t1 / gene=Cvel_2418 / organism=Chromera_velia_CCMP2878 / gene_product=hypothetical protein / transcript_product=hypothetical protein / location=Cvel_scaffold94:98786-102844(+) / protein_length=730 / sequence_SO=supercontig / SO=protein_coding / is_pseudo=false
MPLTAMSSGVRLKSRTSVLLRLETLADWMRVGGGGGSGGKSGATGRIVMRRWRAPSAPLEIFFLGADQRNSSPLQLSSANVQQIQRKLSRIRETNAPTVLAVMRPPPLRDGRLARTLESVSRLGEGGKENCDQGTKSLTCLSRFALLSVMDLCTSILLLRAFSHQSGTPSFAFVGRPSRVCRSRCLLAALSEPRGALRFLWRTADNFAFSLLGSPKLSATRSVWGDPAETADMTRFPSLHRVLKEEERDVCVLMLLREVEGVAAQRRDEKKHLDEEGEGKERETITEIFGEDILKRKRKSEAEAALLKALWRSRTKQKKDEELPVTGQVSPQATLPLQSPHFVQVPDSSPTLLTVENQSSEVAAAEPSSVSGKSSSSWEWTGRDGVDGSEERREEAFKEGQKHRRRQKAEWRRGETGRDPIRVMLLCDPSHVEGLVSRLEWLFTLSPGVGGSMAPLGEAERGRGSAEKFWYGHSGVFPCLFSLVQQDKGRRLKEDFGVGEMRGGWQGSCRRKEEEGEGGGGKERRKEMKIPFQPGEERTRMNDVPPSLLEEKGEVESTGKFRGSAEFCQKELRWRTKKDESVLRQSDDRSPRRHLGAFSSSSPPLTSSSSFSTFETFLHNGKAANSRFPFVLTDGQTGIREDTEAPHQIRILSAELHGVGPVAFLFLVLLPLEVCRQALGGVRAAYNNTQRSAEESIEAQIGKGARSVWRMVGERLPCRLVFPDSTGFPQ